MADTNTTPKRKSARYYQGIAATAYTSFASIPVDDIPAKHRKMFTEGIKTLSSIGATNTVVSFLMDLAKAGNLQAFVNSLQAQADALQGANNG